jgi:hypothetical protein
LPQRHKDTKEKVKGKRFMVRGSWFGVGEAWMSRRVNALMSELIGCFLMFSFTDVLIYLLGGDFGVANAEGKGGASDSEATRSVAGLLSPNLPDGQGRQVASLRKLVVPRGCELRRLLRRHGV